jgi:mannosyltransferase OCH1-like enzyme
LIPKTLHIIWVGDDGQRPDNCIQTWARHNPGWQIKLWGNDDLVERPWINAAHMQAMLGHELNGVADMMRWEILYAEGGFVVDADSICLRPLDDSRWSGASWPTSTTRPRWCTNRLGRRSARSG